METEKPHSPIEEEIEEEEIKKEKIYAFEKFVAGIESGEVNHPMVDFLGLGQEGKDLARRLAYDLRKNYKSRVLDWLREHWGFVSRTNDIFTEAAAFTAFPVGLYLWPFLTYYGEKYRQILYLSHMIVKPAGEFVRNILKYFMGIDGFHIDRYGYTDLTVEVIRQKRLELPRLNALLDVLEIIGEWLSGDLNSVDKLFEIFVQKPPIEATGESYLDGFFKEVGELAQFLEKGGRFEEGPLEDIVAGTLSEKAKNNIQAYRLLLNKFSEN